MLGLVSMLLRGGGVPVVMAIHAAMTHVVGDVLESYRRVRVVVVGSWHGKRRNGL